MKDTTEDLFQIYIAKNYPGWDKLPPGNGFKINVKDAFFAGYQSKQTTPCEECGKSVPLNDILCTDCFDILT